jgi:hypothetical protein
VQFYAGQNKTMTKLLYQDGWKPAVKAFYAMITERLLAEKSYKIAGSTQIDLVRDVGNMAHTHFAAGVFNLPLKDKENPKGVFSEHELYATLALTAICTFFDVDPAESFPLRQAATAAIDKLGKAIETNVKLGSMFGMRGLYTAKPRKDHLSAYGPNLVKALGKSGISPADITWSQIIPAAGAMVPSQGQVVSLIFR